MIQVNKLCYKPCKEIPVFVVEQTHGVSRSVCLSALDIYCN